jgi:hypothetical protein
VADRPIGRGGAEDEELPRRAPQVLSREPAVAFRLCIVEEDMSKGYLLLGRLKWTYMHCVRLCGPIVYSPRAMCSSMSNSTPAADIVTEQISSALTVAIPHCKFNLSNTSSTSTVHLLLGCCRKWVQKMNKGAITISEHYEDYRLSIILCLDHLTYDKLYRQWNTKFSYVLLNKSNHLLLLYVLFIYQITI